jgi:hypothetical protein
MANNALSDEVLLRVAREEIPRLNHCGLMWRGSDNETSMLLRRASGIIETLAERLAKANERNERAA